ncbi:hypothetical protein [Dokdonia sp. Hel_I_53]|nr:hypothetical protein [Dokdonia sp. Hel_I_53]TVZ51385.1 hypothetical protein OD90_0525 [Dokdonia sp. Hel_I_53]
MENKESTKKHADFQDPYRRSLNFKKVQPIEKFAIDGDGEVHIKKEDEK